MATLVRRAQAFFEPEITGSYGSEAHRTARTQILKKFEGTLFGFIEPEPASEALPELPDAPAEAE